MGSYVAGSDRNRWFIYKSTTKLFWVVSPPQASGFRINTYPTGAEALAAYNRGHQ